MLFSLVMLAGVFVAAFSQILLKTSANKIHKSKLKEYLNARVIAAFALFTLSAVMVMVVLRHIQLSLATILESSGYIYVAVLSYCLLKERISRRKLIGMVFVILGTVLFVL